MAANERYPTANILGQRGHWDEATRAVVLDRVFNVPPFRFFGPTQQDALTALCARIVPQDHRSSERRIPIAQWIDARCFNQANDGFRFDDMPPNATAWTWGLEGLDQTATALKGRNFADLGSDHQDLVLRTIGDGNPPGEVWQQMPARRWWIFVALRQITGTYYAHPTAWDDIGFGGPAYPRGYFALNHGAPEPWEPREADDEPEVRR